MKPDNKKAEWEETFVERGASLEHTRWAKWQNYLHSHLTWNNDIQAWVLPHELKDRWQMQINTPYSMLSEKEKESDRKEVRTYLPLISSEKELSRAQGALEGAAQREKEIVSLLEGMKIKASGKDDPWSIQVAHVENQKSYNESLSSAISAIEKKNPDPN